MPARTPPAARAARHDRRRPLRRGRVGGAAPTTDGAGSASLEAARHRRPRVERAAATPPLPPYIRRADGPADRERYQTDLRAGAAAASPRPPRACTSRPLLLDRLRRRGYRARRRWSLHVGPGTFRPGQASRAWRTTAWRRAVLVPAETAAAVARARARGGRVVAVGTTTVRRARDGGRGTDGTVRRRTGETDLVVVPGYRLPRGGRPAHQLPPARARRCCCWSRPSRAASRVLRAYAEAVRAGYRFYSYGDAMLIT